jgi:hypothetical protein
MKAKIEDSDRGWGALFRRVKEAREGRIKVGVLASDKGGESADGGLTLAELATVLHFGTEDGHIPARPFLQITFDEQREELAKFAARLIAAELLGKISGEKAAEMIGAKMAAEVRKTITVGSKLAPNAPSTIAKKGSSRPLIDTGRLLNAITWAVDKKGER